MAETTGTKYRRTPAAARYLGISPRTLEKWRRLGAGPRFVRLGSRLVAYELADLDEFAQRQRSSSAA